MDPTRPRELDEADLRWFWCHAEGDLGLSGSGDFERAAQAMTSPTPRCPRCSYAGGKTDNGHRARRAHCRACLGLGVVVPTTYPSGNAPASPSEVDPWLAIVTGGRESHISPRAPSWMGLTGAAAAHRKKHRMVRLALSAMETGHVVTLHAVLGPAPAQFEGGDDVPEASLILAAMNRALPEGRRDPILRRLRAGHLDRFERSAARRHVDMLLAGSWRAYDRARGRVVDEDREPVVEALAESDRLLKRSGALLKLAKADPARAAATDYANDTKEPAWVIATKARINGEVMRQVASACLDQLQDLGCEVHVDPNPAHSTVTGPMWPGPVKLAGAILWVLTVHAAAIARDR